MKEKSKIQIRKIKNRNQEVINFGTIKKVEKGKLFERIGRKV
jgi:hypothetical protein